MPCSMQNLFLENAMCCVFSEEEKKLSVFFQENTSLFFQKKYFFSKVLAKSLAYSMLFSTFRKFLSNLETCKKVKN